MSERNERKPTSPWRTIWLFGVSAGVLGIALLVGSALSPTIAQGGFGGGHWRHGGDHGDPAEHADLAAEWIVRWVDGTPEQEQQIAAIARNAIEEMLGLREQGRNRHEAFVAEFSKETLDLDAIETLRVESMSMADDASQQLVGALGDVAEVLTQEQRLELIELAQRFHPRRH